MLSVITDFCFRLFVVPHFAYQTYQSFQIAASHEDPLFMIIRKSVTCTEVVLCVCLGAISDLIQTIYLLNVIFVYHVDIGHGYVI